MTAARTRTSIGPAVILPSGHTLDVTGDLARVIAVHAAREAEYAIASNQRRPAEKLLIDAYEVAALAYPEGTAGAQVLTAEILSVSSQYDQRWP